jgi:small subunit ribosomal protein S6
MPLYENVFIARQDISGAQVDALADTFTQLVADNGGEVKKREYWGLRNLTYRMRKNRKGHYVLLNLSAPPAAVSELERTMRINEDVIRYLTIRVDELEEGPSVVMQSRGSRDDRPRRGDRERSGEGREMERPAAERPVPEPALPEPAVPGQAVPGQAVPGQAVPEPAVPEPAVPEQAVPEQAAPEQPVPEQPAPEKVEA